MYVQFSEGPLGFFETTEKVLATANNSDTSVVRAFACSDRGLGCSTLYLYSFLKRSVTAAYNAYNYKISPKVSEVINRQAKPDNKRFRTT